MPRRSVIQVGLRFFPLFLAVAACASPGGAPTWTFTPLETQPGPAAEPSVAAAPTEAAMSPMPAMSPAATTSNAGPDGVMPSSGAGGTDAGPILGTLLVQAFDIGYRPSSLTVAQPGRYLVRFVNTGQVAHDIQFADGTMVDAAAGATAEGELIVPAGGLAFACTKPGHAQVGQQGTLVVGG